MQKCIICDSTEWEDLYRIGHFKLVRCQECGLVSRYPLPTREELINLYSREYFASGRPIEIGYRDYAEMKEVFYRRFRHYLDLVERYKKKGRILDFGCACGFFMELARGNGWEPYGLDISSYASDYGKNILGLNISTGFLEEARFQERFFDAVTLWDILEHLSNPREGLEEVNRILKNKGYIFITVPNMDSWIRKLMGKRWFGFNKIDEHLFYFSPRTMRLLLEKTGFECLKIEKVPWRSNVRFLAEKLGRYSNILQKLVSSLIRSLRINNLELNINFMVFLTVARKK